MNWLMKHWFQPRLNYYIMKYNKFEESLKEQFGSAAMAVDTNELIGNLHLALDQGKKKRGLWWFFMSLILIGSLVTLLNYVPYFASGNNINSNPEISSIAPIGEQEEEVQNENNTFNNKNNINTEDKITQPINLDKITNSESTSHPITINKTSKIKITRSPLILSEESKTNSSDKDIKTRNAQVLNPQHAESIYPLNKEIKEERINLEISPLLGENIFYVEELDKPSIPNPECPTFSGPSAFSYSLLAEAGILFPFRSLQSSSSEPSELLTLRNENESSLPGYHLGLFGKVNSNRYPLYIKAGVSYNKLNEKIDLSSTIIRQDTTRGLISVTTGGNGDTLTYIYGDIITESIIEKKDIKHYYFHLVDIPISIGYELRRRAFNINVEAGVSINVFTKSTGRLLTTPTEFSSLSEENFFKDNIGLSYNLGFSIERPITPMGAVYLGVNYRYIPRNISRTGYEIEQYYRLLGVNLGYRKRF